MGLFHVVAEFDSVELCHQSVHHEFVVLGLVCLGIVEDAEFYQLGVGQVVECEEVGTGLLECAAVLLERVAVHSGEKLAGAVAETFMEVGVQHVGDIEVIIEKLAGGGVDHELFIEAVAVRGHRVCLGDVLYGHRF